MRFPPIPRASDLDYKSRPLRGEDSLAAERPTALAQGGSPGRFVAIGLITCALFTGCKSPSSSPVHPGREYSVRSMDDLVHMNRCDLESLYRHSEMGGPPMGVTDGRAIVNPGSPFTAPTATVTRIIWQGKVFTEDNMMVNRVFGLRAIRARVSPGESWLDGKPSLILDYADTSKMYSHVRDEVREISPGLYLGIAYHRTSAGPELNKFFTLDSRKQ